MSVKKQPFYKRTSLFSAIYGFRVAVYGFIYEKYGVVYAVYGSIYEKYGVVYAVYGSIYEKYGVVYAAYGLVYGGKELSFSVFEEFFAGIISICKSNEYFS